MMECGVWRYCEVREGLVGDEARKCQVRARNWSQEAGNCGKILDIKELIDL